jgi:hypothetical protein
VDVNGDNAVTALDALRVARQAVEVDRSLPLFSKPVWDDTDIVHVVSADQDTNTPDLARSLVGVPPGIGLTVRADGKLDPEKLREWIQSLQREDDRAEGGAAHLLLPAVQ